MLANKILVQLKKSFVCVLRLRRCISRKDKQLMLFCFFWTMLLPGRDKIIVPGLKLSNTCYYSICIIQCLFSFFFFPPFFCCFISPQVQLSLSPLSLRCASYFPDLRLTFVIDASHRDRYEGERERSKKASHQVTKKNKESTDESTFLTSYRSMSFGLCH